MVGRDDLLVSSRSPLQQIGAGFSEIFEGLRRSASDAVIMSSFVSFMLVLAGFGAFYLAWRGAAATLAVAIQLAYLFSGGVSGLALIAAGMGIMYVQMSRHLAAREEREWAVVLDRALAVLDGIRRTGRLGKLRVTSQHDLAG